MKNPTIKLVNLVYGIMTGLNHFKLWATLVDSSNMYMLFKSYASTLVTVSIRVTKSCTITPRIRTYLPIKKRLLPGQQKQGNQIDKRRDVDYPVKYKLAEGTLNCYRQRYNEIGALTSFEEDCQSSNQLFISQICKTLWDFCVSWLIFTLCIWICLP